MKAFIPLSSRAAARPLVPFDIQSVRVVRAHWADQGYALEIHREGARHQPSRPARLMR